MLKYDKNSMVIVPREPTEYMVSHALLAISHALSPRNAVYDAISAAPEVEPVIALSDVMPLVEALRFYANEVNYKNIDTFAGKWNGVEVYKNEIAEKALQQFEEKVK